MSVNSIERMSDSELVAVVLGKKPSDPAVVALSAAMATDGWLSAGPLAQVCREYGSVGPRGVARLESAIELGRRALAARAARRGRVISTPEDVAELIRPYVVGIDQERFFAALLNVKNMLLKVVPISSGSINASIVAPSVLFKEAIQVGAASVIAAHQHPSNDPAPSASDIQLTRRLVKAGDVLGIEVLDHVVIGGDQHSSLRELGLM